MPVLCLSLLPALVLPVSEGEPIAAETVQLSKSFWAEGASAGDLDRDGHIDIVAGPYWYAGPEFVERHALYEGKEFDTAGYSDHFFSWTHDLDRDGWLDVFVVGFPGREAYWLESREGGKEWSKHVVFMGVDNESPAWVDITGDGRPELICQHAGEIGWVEQAQDPRQEWTWHAAAPTQSKGPYVHGLGVGDVSGDGRADLLLNEGWWEQPASLEGDPVWESRPHRFSEGHGGAQMLVFDVDGDGDNDLVTSLNAHRYGLSWFENLEGDGVHWSEHRMLADDGTVGTEGLNVSELHSLAAGDLDGDGLTDFVTGKRFLSHGRSEPGSSDPPHLLACRLRRGPEGPSFLIESLHDASGVGTQVSLADLDGDGGLDVVVASKAGVFASFVRLGEAALELRAAQAEERAQAAASVAESASEVDPTPHRQLSAGEHLPRNAEGRVLNLDFEAGDLRDWTAELDAFSGQPIEGDTVVTRRDDQVSDHRGRFWIGGYELHQDGRWGTLTSDPFVLSAPWLSFWIAGGNGNETRVDVLDAEGQKLISATGREHEALRPVKLELEHLVGQELRLRLIDNSSGGWGHINFDHVRLHDAEPTFELPVEENAWLDVTAHEGLPPTEAAAAMTVPPGFRVDLIAGEPDVHQPVALAIDGRGRLFVAEAHSYPKKRGEGLGEDRVLILADEDGDGSFESHRVFIDGLDLVSGLAVGFGGVWIGQAPELLFVPDADADGVPDGEPVVLLDGWGMQDTHETLNAFTWGPDGWLYGCHGVFTHSRVGRPGTPDAERTPINAGVWRFHPTRHEFEVFAWGTSNPWGVDFDERGQAFITACVIPHLYHMVQGGRYIRQAGSHFNAHAYTEIDTIADHLHYVGGWAHSGNGRSAAVGGGHAHCGAMLYLGDQFPEEYRGKLLFNNVHGNRVNSERLERAGSGFVGKHEPDFLLANDTWFRGINLCTGPDGSVFLIDWYDPRACHSNTPEIWDRSNGRVYRVSYGEPERSVVDVSNLRDEELIAAQADDNAWWRRNARRVMQERGSSPALRAGLFELLASAEDEVSALRALWSLHGIGELDEGVLRPQLASEHELVRAWAVQLMCEDRKVEEETLRALESLAEHDESPVVRLYLASALQRLTLDERWGIARGLLMHAQDADDHNLPTLYWYGLEPLVAHDAARLLDLVEACSLEDITRWSWRRAAAEESLLEPLFARLARDEDSERVALAIDEIEQALRDRRGVSVPASWRAAYERVRRTSDEQARDKALALAVLFRDSAAAPELRVLALDEGQDIERRRRALETLRADESEGRPQTAEALLQLVQHPELARDAVRALASFDDARTPDALLARYPAFDADGRADTLATLVTRVPWSLALLDAVERGDVARADLDAQSLLRMSNAGDPTLDVRLAEVWGQVRATAEERQQQISEWVARLTPERLAAADRSHGRAVFARTCVRCHELWGEGGAIGPQLTGANRGDIEYLVTNSVDPSAVVPLEYQATIVSTEDGLILTGLLTEEDDEILVLTTETDRHVIEQSEVAFRRLDEHSMMPDGQLETLTEEEAVDLFAYLHGEAQVPQLLTDADVASVLDSLDSWDGDPELWKLEDGELVGRTSGLARNEFLRSRFALRDFHLTLEVKLTPNEENSGIQFRSAVHGDADVAGYQADIGAGWWGKLYEEHGRAVLFEDSAESAVRPNEWNRYEIRALGDHLQTWLNGELSVDLVDPEGARSGILAFQLHSGGALELRVRGLELQLLEAED